jgi:ABC-type lipoprotein release transport system permease subunit
MVLRLAWRSIWRNRRRTLITVSSIGMGLAFAFFFIAFADGVYYKLIHDGVRMQAGHITLEHRGYHDAPAIDLYIPDPGALRARIDGLDYVERTKLLVLGQGVARSGLGTVGVAVMGIEPSVERKTSPLVGSIVKGRYLEDGDRSLVVVGNKLAKRLHVRVGKKLVLVTNDVNGALTEELCRVAGIFETGVDEVDGYLLQAPINFIRKLYGFPPGGATELGVILKNPEALKKVQKEIRSMIKQKKLSVYRWSEILPELASYIKLDKGSNLIFQAILIFLILFTIFNTILMSILERQKEFAVLMALGTKPSLLKRQLILESAFIGLLGCFVGLLVGGLAAYALQVWGFDIRKVVKQGMSISGFGVSPIMHARVTLSLFLWLGGIVLGATLLLSLIPMRRVSKIDIAETLR